MIYYALLGALALQRLSEVKLGNTNLARLRPRLVSEPDEREKKQMLLLHGAWFASCVAEHAVHRQLVSPGLFSAGMAALVLCQVVRYASMQALGESWVHLPVAYRGQKFVTDGIYRFCRHPNYAVVVVEIALVPALAKAYLTALVFSTLNLLFLWRRIQIEEAQMKKARNL